MGSARDRPDDDGNPVGLAPPARPSAGAPHQDVDARAHAAWRTWLGALASDPKAAMAAALAYESLPGQARDAWLEALDVDAPGIRVPKVALYAPLLAVEADEARRARIERALADEAPHGPYSESAASGGSATHALRGVAPNGERVCIVVTPLYLDFVELLVCRYGADGITSARHEPLSHLREKDPVPEADDAPLELTPVPAVVEDLAHAVVAHRRAGREPPEALHRFIHLFGLIPGAEGAPGSGVAPSKRGET